MHDEPALANLWWDRDQTPDDLKKVRRAFTHGAIKTAIEKADASLSALVEAHGRIVRGKTVNGQGAAKAPAVFRTGANVMFRATILLVAVIFGLSPALAGKGGGSQNANSSHTSTTSSPNGSQAQPQKQPSTTRQTGTMSPGEKFKNH
jgi:hypothetical protein